MNSLLLPTSAGDLQRYELSRPKSFTKPTGRIASRTLYAAAHVVAQPLASDAQTVAVDWDATMAFRHHLWSWGLGVAEAMDTAQRGMGLDYQATKELISRSAREARAVGGGLVCGAATDNLPAGAAPTLDEIAAAYLEQTAHIEGEGAMAVLMCSRHLAAAAAGEGDYRKVYDRVLSEVRGPVIIHWLGEMFDPALAGYWGHDSIDRAMQVCLEIIGDHAAKVDGIKLSLLDAGQEVKLRRLLPDGVKMYTGDDFNYDELIIGDDEGFSHALLGIFDGIAPAASAALQALDAGNESEYRELLAATVPLSRHIFSTPTYYYKAGLVFLAYLNGHQDHFRMVAGLESSRSVNHMCELFRLADAAGLLAEPELAVRRMKAYLALAGIEA